MFVCQDALSQAADQLDKYLATLLSSTEDLVAEHEAKNRVQTALSGRLGARRQDLHDARAVARAERERARRNCKQEAKALEEVQSHNQVLLREGKFLAAELQSIERRRQCHLKFMERFASAIESVRRQQASLLGVGAEGASDAQPWNGADVGAGAGAGAGAGFRAGTTAASPVVTVSSLRHAGVGADGASRPGASSTVSSAVSGSHASESDDGNGVIRDGVRLKVALPAAASVASRSTSPSRGTPASVPRIRPSPPPGATLDSAQLARSSRRVEAGVWVLPVRRVAGPSGTAASGAAVLEALVVEASSPPSMVAAADAGDGAPGADTDAVAVPWKLIHGACRAAEAPERAALRVFRERVALLEREAGMSLATVKAARVGGAFGSLEVSDAGSDNAARRTKVMLVLLPPDERGAFAGAKAKTHHSAPRTQAWLSKRHRWVTAEQVDDLAVTDSQTRTFVLMGLASAPAEFQRHEGAFGKPSPAPSPMLGTPDTAHRGLDRPSSRTQRRLHSGSRFGGGADSLSSDADADADGDGDADDVVSELLAPSGSGRGPLDVAGVGLLGQAGELSVALTTADDIIRSLQKGVTAALTGKPPPAAARADGANHATPSLPDLDEMRSRIQTLPQCLCSGANVEVLGVLESVLSANVSLLHRFFKWRWLPRNRARGPSVTLPGASAGAGAGAVSRPGTDSAGASVRSSRSGRSGRSMRSDRSDRSDRSAGGSTDVAGNPWAKRVLGSTVDAASPARGNPWSGGAAAPHPDAGPSTPQGNPWAARTPTHSGPVRVPRSAGASTRHL